MLSDQEIYNQRQYKLMLEIIKLHKKDNTDPDYLVSSLLNLIGCIHNIDLEYEKKFVTFCNGLDYAYLNLRYYSATEEEKNNHKEEIDLYLNELIKMITPKILSDNEF